jgi:hypothetical protein
MEELLSVKDCARQSNSLTKKAGSKSWRMSPSDEFDRPFPRLGEMIERLALDPVEALRCEAAALGSAIQRCQACECDAICREWLAGSAATTVDAPPAFCPSAALLVGLRGKQAPSDIGWWL